MENKITKKLVLISDVHDNLEGIKKLPKADILINAGDEINANIDGKEVVLNPNLNWILKTFRRSEKFFDIIEGQKHKFKEVFQHGGNHSILMDNNRKIGGTNDQRRLVETMREVYINKYGVLVEKVQMKKTEDGLKVIVAPITDDRYISENESNGGAFLSTPEDYDEIERIFRENEKIDILSIHQPPFGFGDKDSSGNNTGSIRLLEIIEKYQPSLVVCGHIHEARGEYMIGNTRVVNAACSNSDMEEFVGYTVIDHEFELPKKTRKI